MNCPECHNLLQQRLDGEPLADRAALEHHLAQCGECRDCYLAAQRLTEGLGRLARPVPSAGLAGRIVARVLAEQRARRVWRRRIVTAAAVAAGLLLMTFVGSQRLGWFGSTKDDSLVNREKPSVHNPKAPSAKQPSLPEGPGSPLLDQTLAEAGSTALALTRRTAGLTMAQARQLLPSANSLPVPLSGLPEGRSLAPVLGSPAQSLRQAGHNMSDGLEPVTTSARRALNLFFREMPALNSEQQSGS